MKALLLDRGDRGPIAVANGRDRQSADQQPAAASGAFRRQRRPVERLIDCY
jgi:hypothetical protein